MNELIQILRDGNKVRVTFKNGPLGYEFYFYYDCQGDVYASLLSEHFKDRLQSIVKQIREEEYNQGYKDGRAKRGKKAWFSWALKKIY